MSGSRGGGGDGGTRDRRRRGSQALGGGNLRKGRLERVLGGDLETEKERGQSFD